MPTYVNDAGTWRQIRNIYVNDAGTWRQLAAIWVNDNGTWRQVFTSVDLHDFSVSLTASDPSDAHVGFSLQGSLSGAPGYVGRQSGTSTPPGNLTTLYTYIQPGSEAANYEVRVTQLSGTVNVASGAALNTWIRLDIITTGSFFVSRQLVGTSTATALVELRRFSDSVVVDSCTVTMTATVEFVPP